MTIRSMAQAIQCLGSGHSLIHSVMGYAVFPDTVSNTNPLSVLEHFQFLERPGVNLNCILWDQPAWPMVGPGPSVANLCAALLDARQRILAPTGLSIHRISFLFPSAEAVEEVGFIETMGQLSLATRLVRGTPSSAEVDWLDVFFFPDWDLEHGGYGPVKFCLDDFGVVFNNEDMYNAGEWVLFGAMVLPIFFAGASSLFLVRSCCVRVGPTRPSREIAQVLCHELGHTTASLIHDSDNANLMFHQGQADRIQLTWFQAKQITISCWTEEGCDAT